MSRNSSGVYTLPIAAYQPGTVIKSSDMNTNLSDIALALTQSVASTGVTPMTGPLKLADGTISAPMLTLASDTTTGWYKSASGEWTYVSAGVAAFVINGSTGTFNGALTVAGNVTFNGALTVAGTFSVGQIITPLVNISSSGSVPAAPSPSNVLLYNQGINFNGVPFAQTLYTIDYNGNISPVYYKGGQCRLTLNGSNLLLSPYMGNVLTVNGLPREIPAAGISLAASNTANTFVYIYAYMSTVTTMALELSTTGYSFNTALGINVKSTDASRTLVGAAYTDTGGAWADTDGKLWVLSFFNRKRKTSKVNPNIGSTYNTFATVTVSTEVNTLYRNQFISWADEVPEGRGSFCAYTSGAGALNFIMIRVDNVANNNAMGQAQFYAGSGQNQTVELDVKVSGITENTVHNISFYAIASNTGLNYAGAGPSNVPSSYNMMYIMG